MDVIGRKPLGQPVSLAQRPSEASGCDSSEDRWWECLEPPGDDFESSHGLEAPLALGDRRSLCSSLILIQECKSRADGGWSDVNRLPGEDLQKKLSREQMYRQTAARICDELPWHQMKIRGRLRDCGGYMMFREWLDTGIVSLRAATFCNRTRLCPGCAHWSAVRTVVKWVPKFENLLCRGDLVPLLVTFTIRDGDDLAERLTVLRSGLSAVGKRVREARRGNSKSAFSGVVGAVARIEVKRGKNSGQWHPHAHALVLRERLRMFPLSDMQAEWRSLVGRGNLNVRLAYSARSMIESGVVDQVRLHADLAEVIKYTMKFGEMSPADVVEAWQVIHGKRMAFSLGACYGMKEQPAAPDQDELSGEWRDWSCRYNHVEGRYYVSCSGEGLR